MKTTVKDFLGACLLGAILGAMFAYSIPAEAQTVQMTNSAGYNVGTVQINGNTAQFVNPMGYTTQTATIYPNWAATLYDHWKKRQRKKHYTQGCQSKPRFTCPKRIYN